MGKNNLTTLSKAALSLMQDAGVVSPDVKLNNFNDTGVAGQGVAGVLLNKEQQHVLNILNDVREGNYGTAVDREINYQNHSLCAAQLPPDTIGVTFCARLP